MAAHLRDALSTSAPELQGRRAYAPPGDDVERVTLAAQNGSTTTTVDVVLDPTHCCYATWERRADAASSDGASSIQIYVDTERARDAFNAAVDRRRKKGWK